MNIKNPLDDFYEPSRPNNTEQSKDVTIESLYTVMDKIRENIISIEKSLKNIENNK